MVDERYVRYQGKYKKKNPNRAKHLEQYKWKPGQSGNPEGRPTGSISLVEKLKAYLRRHPEEALAIVIKLVEQGKQGNIVATKELLDRIDGKVAERHRIEGEMPVKLLFVPAQELLNAPERAQHQDLEALRHETIPALSEGKEGG
jgi:hypothetical protein